MTLKHKTYAALIAAALISAGILANSIWSNYQIAKLERAVEAAKNNAETVTEEARELEKNSVEYLQKIKYLEDSLSKIETIARRQDQEIEKLSKNTNAARNGVRHARSVRAIESSGADLCARLAEIGHACDE